MRRRRADAASGILRAALRLCGDIATGQDALARDQLRRRRRRSSPIRLTRDRTADAPLIPHFLRVAPTVWLLLPADWLPRTKWFAPFLPHCTDIVAFGRVCWFEGTEDTGKDNFAWYRFDDRHTAGPIFHARGVGAGVVARQPVRAMRQAVSAAAIELPVLLQRMSPARLSRET